MSKRIRLTDEDKTKLCKEFEEYLGKQSFAGGKISFERSLTAKSRKATIKFTELAWNKMQAIIRENSKEVAWHGLARRSENPDDDIYEIYDILVYPQVVSGATVDADEEKYGEWIMSLPPEVKCDLRMQGHSHVDMGTTPSSTDKDYYRDLLAQVTPKMFYIFMIWNRQQDSNIWIYDMAKNILFEDNDITINVSMDDIGIEKFLADSEKLISEKKYTAPTKTSYWKDKPSKPAKTEKQAKYIESKMTKYSSLDDYYAGQLGWEEWYDEGISPYYGR